MSIFDVVTGAREWLAAIDEHEKVYEDFRNNAALGTYDHLTAAARAEKSARHAHLAAVRDLPNDGVPDDRRIAVLRTENERLRQQVRKLRMELNTSRENNEDRNRELDALHFVWCDGGCTSGVHRYCGKPEDLTEEVVKAAERNTQRMRRWFINFTARKP